MWLGRTFTQKELERQHPHPPEVDPAFSFAADFLLHFVPFVCGSSPRVGKALRRVDRTVSTSQCLEPWPWSRCRRTRVRCRRLPWAFRSDRIVRRSWGAICCRSRDRCRSRLDQCRGLTLSQNPESCVSADSARNFLCPTTSSNRMISKWRRCRCQFQPPFWWPCLGRTRFLKKIMSILKIAFGVVSHLATRQISFLKNLNPWITTMYAIFLYRY